MNTEVLKRISKLQNSVATLMRDKRFKSFLSTLYSLGASVVVLGALFKIQHWPGAGFMLAAGLITEALIFFIYAFEPSDDAAHHTDMPLTITHERSEALIPANLDNNGEDVSHTSHVRAETLIPTGEVQEHISGRASLSLSRFDKMLEEAAITPDVFFKLGEGMKKLGETTETMNSMVDVSAASIKYMETIRKADKSLEQTAKSYELIISNATAKTAINSKSIAHSLSNVESGAKEFEQQMSSLNKNLSALNTVYKLQKKGADEILKEQAESAAESKIYREQIKELNKNLSALNHLYSNMLSAVKTK